jgi:hypothetical protein
MHPPARGVASALFLVLASGLSSTPARAQAGDAASRARTVVLASSGDRFLPLAQEIAHRDTLPLAESVAAAFAAAPDYLLWVVSPGGLSDSVLIDFMQRDRTHSVAVGIISGSTVAQARALWLRHPVSGPNMLVAVNGEYPAAGVFAGRITAADSGARTRVPLTTASLRDVLGQADYLTFTGHGSAMYWRLDPETTFRASDVPPLPPVVVGTASCQTVRIWNDHSIALRFVDQGAAGYAGFVYSPIEGYLLGEFDGLPFRYTWPGFPIGRVVQVQSAAAARGFARLPFYVLLGDPRAAFHQEPPYRLLSISTTQGTRVLEYADAPAGFLPVKIDRGARYRFARIRGEASVWTGSPFYNARAELLPSGEDAYLLTEHRGGPFTVELRTAPAWSWIVMDVIGDALDDVYVFRAQGGGGAITLVLGVIVALALTVGYRRSPPPLREVVAVLVVGAGVAGLHVMWDGLRIHGVTITSKPVALTPISWVGTWILVAGGALLYLRATTRLRRVLAVAVAVAPLIIGAAVMLAMIGALNLQLHVRIGTGLYGYGPVAAFGMALVVELPVVGLAFLGARRATRG